MKSSILLIVLCQFLTNTQLLCISDQQINCKNSPKAFIFVVNCMELEILSKEKKRINQDKDVNLKNCKSICFMFYCYIFIVFVIFRDHIIMYHFCSSFWENNVSLCCTYVIDFNTFFWCRRGHDGMVVGF